MTDSVAVFSPGDRLTDNATAAEMSGAVAYFYDAGTTNPKTVYADKDLTVALGTSVTADALGYPTSDGTTRTLVYTGTSDYKIVIKDANGVTVVTHDDVKGAPTTYNPGSQSVVAETPVVTKSLNYTVLSTDQSTVFVGNCSSGDVAFTLPSAVDVGDGWFVDIQHAGSANQILIETVSSQTISSGALSYSTVMVLTRSGESVRLTSDGGNWRVTAHSPPHIKVGQGIITVVDRLTAPPGSEVNGSVYLISGSPSGDWSSFSAGDLVQYTSSAWVRFAPLEGWRVWVADEDLGYTYDGSSWLSDSASDTKAGIVEKATQAEVEAETADKYPDAESVKYAPGVAKFWVCINYSAGTPSVAASYNVTGIVDNGTGDLTVTIATDFSSTSWVPFALGQGSNGRFVSVAPAGRTEGTVRIIVENSGGSSGDPDSLFVGGFGDHA